MKLLKEYLKLKSRCIEMERRNDRLAAQRDKAEFSYKKVRQENDDLRRQNAELRKLNRDHALLRCIFGDDHIDTLVRQAKQTQQAKREQRKINYDYER